MQGASRRTASPLPHSWYTTVSRCLKYGKNYTVPPAARDIRAAARTHAGQSGLAQLDALPRGPHSLTREQVADNQRARLRRAMLAAIGQNGYGATTVSAVVTRAGVSRKAFYEHFANKEECFLAAYEVIAADARSRVNRVLESEAQRERTEQAIRTLFELATANPDAMRLATTEIAAIGPAGLERRERAVLEYGRLINDCLAADYGAGNGAGALPETVLRGMMGGLTRVIATYMRRGRRARPHEVIPGLVRWISSYYPAPAALHSALSAKTTDAGCAHCLEPLGGRAPGTLAPRLPLGGRRVSRRHLNLSRSFVVQSQRERILDAVTNLTAANGYVGLTVEDIAAEAAVSLQAFYEHFESKEDAFLVAYELGHARCVSIVEQTIQGGSDWAQGVRCGLQALTGFLASEPAFASLSLLGTLIASPRAVELSTRGLATYAELLTPGLRENPRLRERPRLRGGPRAGRLPPLTVAATAGGLHELFLHHTTTGRTGELPELVIDATYLALAPFLGAEEACAAAGGGPGA
jgi:AcrR family transcriptional regulator